MLSTCSIRFSFSHFISTMIREEYELWRSSLCKFLQPPVPSCLMGLNVLLSILLPNALNLCPFHHITKRFHVFMKWLPFKPLIAKNREHLLLNNADHWQLLWNFNFDATLKWKSELQLIFTN
jgi:hypothetical protein